MNPWHMDNIRDNRTSCLMSYLFNRLFSHWFLKNPCTWSLSTLEKQFLLGLEKVYENPSNFDLHRF